MSRFKNVIIVLTANRHLAIVFVRVALNVASESGIPVLFRRVQCCNVINFLCNITGNAKGNCGN